MNLHVLTLSVSIVGFVFFGLCIILLWGKVNNITDKGNQDIDRVVPERRGLYFSEAQIDNKFDHIMKLINAQSALIGALSNGLDGVGKSANTEKKEDIGKEKQESAAAHSIRSLNETSSDDPGSMGPNLSVEGADRKLDSLLNGTDFRESIWQQFSKPFDVCAAILVKYLGANGIPTPKIEPYPELRDNNPNFWTFMIVQAQSWQTKGKRFIIPLNFDRYDPLKHEHLFNVRGNVNKPDNYINGLVRCAVLKDGELSGYIDKKLVEIKGIIEVE